MHCRTVSINSLNTSLSRNVLLKVVIFHLELPPPAGVVLQTNTLTGSYLLDKLSDSNVLSTANLSRKIWVFQPNKICFLSKDICPAWSTLCGENCLHLHRSTSRLFGGASGMQIATLVKSLANTWPSHLESLVLSGYGPYSQRLNGGSMAGQSKKLKTS